MNNETIKLLFLAANPSDTTRLRLDKEIRAIDQALRQVEYRDKFEIEQHWAVRVNDLQAHLLRHKPDIVHFSGHGSASSAIVLESESDKSHPVSVRALSQLFSILRDNIRCVVLNACYSEKQARAIAEHIDCVVGMSKSIGDLAAISFATSFYQALGYGESVRTAFELGCVQIDLENLNEQDTPKLISINNKAEEVVFAQNSVKLETQQHKKTFQNSAFESTCKNSLTIGLPPLPNLETFVGRDEALTDLKSFLGIRISPQKELQKRFIIMRGWPGVGKTTLATVLVHDADVQDAFHDGIFWASLGEQPDILLQIKSWGRALGIDNINPESNLDDAIKQLTHVFSHKKALLIIDDVYDITHAAPFKRIGGTACTSLFTTRFNDIADMLADRPNQDIYRLKRLSDEKSLELLALLTPEVVDEYPKEALELVSDLEGLPLAIQVAGRLLYAEARHGWGIKSLLDELREGAALLEAKAPSDRIDLANETTPSIAALLRKSTDRLDEETKLHFSLLGVFAPKPATFDLAAMQFVWQVDDPKPIARRLVDRGLLEPVSGRFQMHSLLVTHAVSLQSTE